MIKSHKEIGIEIKRIRKDLQMSQMKLAERVGVSFQQIQKYEKGINKISVEMIQRIAMALGISVNAFFGKEEVLVVSEPAGKYCSKRENLTNDTFLPLNPEEVCLLQLFRKIENRNIKEGLMKQMGGIVELERRKRSK